MHQHRPVQGGVTTVSVQCGGNRRYVTLACDNVPAGGLPPTGTVIGIDRGAGRFLTTSEGEHPSDPRFLGTVVGELAAAQRHLAAQPPTQEACACTRGWSHFGTCPS